MAADLNDNVNNLIDACSSYISNKSNQTAKLWSTVGGAVIGGTAGGVLAYQATRSIQNANLDKVQQAAYNEWMEGVGKHNRCYIGGEEVGMYGEMISTAME